MCGEVGGVGGDMVQWVMLFTYWGGLTPCLAYFSHISSLYKHGAIGAGSPRGPGCFIQTIVDLPINVPLLIFQRHITDNVTFPFSCLSCHQPLQVVSDIAGNLTGHPGRHLLAAATRLQKQEPSHHVSYIKLEGADSTGHVSRNIYYRHW